MIKPVKDPMTEQDLDRTDRLIEQAVARIKAGFAPPREIYALPYRGRIDWSALPSWSWPTDPESYEGCGHEG